MMSLRADRSPLIQIFDKEGGCGCTIIQGRNPWSQPLLALECMKMVYDEYKVGLIQRDHINSRIMELRVTIDPIEPAAED